MEIKDLRDWAAFGTGVIVPAIIGVFLLSADLQRAPASIQIAFAVVVMLAVFAAAVAFLFWRNLHIRLGLVAFRQRNTTAPIHTVYEGVQRSYRWHGLSAVNELVGQTEVQSAIATRSSEGASFAFVLAEPRDWIRVAEQKRWENNKTRSVEKLIENIEGSQKVLRDLQTNGARVSLMCATRLSSFRIVEVDDERIEVAHYDRDGCGFSGTFLVLKRSRFGDSKKGDGMLYEWFKRAADLERKNAVLDRLYDVIAGLLKIGRTKTEIVHLLKSDVRFEDLRRQFDSHFEWKLCDDDINKSVDFISQRLEVPA
jgi:hypothetical protein